MRVDGPHDGAERLPHADEEEDGGEEGGFWASGTKPLTQDPAVVRAVWVFGTKPFTQNPAVVRADIVLLWLHGPGHELDASLKGKAT